MRRGGKQWKQGADTCVLDPIVACTNEDDKLLIPADQRKNYVSRVVDKLSTDKDVESELRTYYPKLFSERMVAVHLLSCAPAYSAEDEKSDIKTSDPGGCNTLKPAAYSVNKMETHTNLITPRFDGNLNSYVNTLLGMNVPVGSSYASIILTQLSGALVAAVSLVDDQGPWIVHADCHYGNILFTKTSTGIRSALSDFGRIVFVDNPYDDESINKGVADWANVLDLRSIERFNYLKTFDQHPEVVLSRLDVLNPTVTPELTERRRRTLRGFTPYAILNLMYAYLDQETPREVQELLDTTSQESLQSKLNSFLASNNAPLVTEAMIAPSARTSLIPQSVKDARKAARKAEYKQLEQQAAEAAQPGRMAGETGILGRMFGLGKRRKTRRGRGTNASSSRRPLSSPTRTARRSFS